MRYRDLPTLTPTPTPATPPAPAPELPGPLAVPGPAPAAATAAEAPRATLPYGVRVPAGMECASALALAEVAELPAAGPWAELPIPFGLVWLCGRRTLFTTWHNQTYAHLRRQKAIVLHPTEWDAITLAAHSDRAGHVITQWVERKVINPLFEIDTDIAMGGAVIETHTQAFTVAHVGHVWSLDLIGLLYGPEMA